MSRADELRMVWRGPISKFLRDQTPEIDLEGALNCGKTTACLWKVRNSTIEFPGIWWLICRYADGDTTTKLCPAFEEVCRVSGEVPHWHAEEMFYEFRNRSRVYAFGLASPDHQRRYAKLRGLGVSGIYNDQTEELPGDFAGELRARLRQPGYPKQLLFSPNPPNVTHWLAKEFPESNKIESRHYYSVSLYDNQHNLPPETIKALERAYPPEHAKHRSVIMGKRGLNVTGDPVYGLAFKRALHVGPVSYDPRRVLIEAFDFGGHHPCWVAAQRPYDGGIRFLGGIMGQDLDLEAFLPMVLEARESWFAPMMGVQTCCDPAGAHQTGHGLRYTAVDVLREHGFRPQWKENANAPDVRSAMIERLTAYMRRRNATGEAFTVNNAEDRWWLGSTEGLLAMPFLADGFEAGYVWSEHFVSVSRKQIRQPKKDKWYEHGQNCAEYLELTYGANSPTQEDLDERAQARRREMAMKQSRARTPSPTGWMAG